MIANVMGPTYARPRAPIGMRSVSAAFRARRPRRRAHRGRARESPRARRCAPVLLRRSKAAGRGERRERSAPVCGCARSASLRSSISGVGGTRFVLRDDGAEAGGSLGMPGGDPNRGSRGRQDLVKDELGRRTHAPFWEYVRNLVGSTFHGGSCPNSRLPIRMASHCRCPLMSARLQIVPNLSDGSSVPSAHARSETPSHDELTRRVYQLERALEAIERETETALREPETAFLVTRRVSTLIRRARTGPPPPRRGIW